MKSDHSPLTIQWQTEGNPIPVAGTMSSITSGGTATQKSRLGNLAADITHHLSEIFNNHVAPQGCLSFEEALGVLSNKLKEQFPLMQDRIAQHEATGFLEVIRYR